MEKDTKHIQKIISDKSMRITPQRIAVLDALTNLRTHPTADDIIQYIRNEHPNVSVGTVYNTLEAFTEKGIIKKIKTDKDIMRYDAITEKHFHLYCESSDRIEDYHDKELNNLIEGYFKSKKINHFEVDEIQIQINGRFTDYYKKH